MQTPDCDVVIVGAGFSGLYLTHCLRGKGFTVRGFETGSDVGGTWYWNRYPGARCDVESMQYSYSFSDELQQEWQWPELFSAQPDILKYLSHVADRFDLRRSFNFNTTVERAHFNGETGCWQVRTSAGENLTTQYCIMATGCISAAQIPDIPGLESFQGGQYHTGNWPHEGVDFTGQRIAVIGTGSSGIQAIPVLAEQAAHVTVFQRTANYSLPAHNEIMRDDYAASWKIDYPGLREKQRQTFKGVVGEAAKLSGLTVSDEERKQAYEAAWQRGGSALLASYKDMLFDDAVNETAAEFVRDKIRQTVKDPATAEILAAKGYPIGTKRICIDSGYFETYNRDNVDLIDLKATPIERISPTGIKTTAADYGFDSIVFATGFDAMTGTLFKVDIQGLENAKLRDHWDAGPRTYLGLMSHGFPNLFMITGPGSPSVLTNMVVSIEQHVEWVTDCLCHMRDQGMTQLQPELDAQDNWVEHVNEVAHRTLFPKAASWYMGANIPGKPRVFMPYVGGAHAYRQICDTVVAEDYKGFQFAIDQPMALTKTMDRTQESSAA